MLSIESAQSGYGASQVLFGVDLQIGAGQVVTLLGRNGMGKTTLLRTLFGQLPLRGGKIRFVDQDISGWSPDRIARTGMAIVPEGRQCFPNLTVREHLTAFVAARNPAIGEPWTPERVFELFPRLGERARNMGNQLSGGEQARVLIARALAQQTPLLMVDEPIAGLDPAHQIGTMESFAALAAEGKSVIVSLHDLGLAARHCTRILMLSQGRLIADGSPAEVLTPERLNTVFGIRVFYENTAQGPIFQPTEVTR